VGEGIDQDELDRLFTAALETAIALIEKQGDFFPVLFEMRPDRTIQTVAVLDRGAVADPLASIHEALRPRAQSGAILASAIASQRKGPGGELKVCVSIRSPNYAQDVLTGYRLETSGFLKRKRKVELSETIARPVQNEIFAQS
jgi:hypothetical protein